MMKDAPAGKRTGQALLGGPAPLPDGSTGAQKDAVKDGVAAKNGATAKNGPGRAPAVVCALLTKIREVMWQDASIMRGGKELAGAIKQLEAIEPTLRSEEHTSELQSRLHLVCRLLLEKKKN